MVADLFNRCAYQNVSIDSMSVRSAEPSSRLMRYSRIILWRRFWFNWKKKRPRSSRDTSITLLAMLLINLKIRAASTLTNHPLRLFLHWTFESHYWLIRSTLNRSRKRKILSIKRSRLHSHRKFCKRNKKETLMINRKSKLKWKNRWRTWIGNSQAQSIK